MKPHTAPLALSVAAVVAIGTAVVAAGLAETSAAAQDNSVGSSDCRETRSLEGELLQAQKTLASLAARTHRATTATENARRNVEKASGVIRDLDRVDDLLIRLRRQMRPLAKLPALRGLGPVVAGLSGLEKVMHPVRVQGDSAGEKLLKPLNGRLRTLERKLKASRAGIDQAAGETDQACKHLAALRGFVAGRGGRAAEVAALEGLAGKARASLRALQAGLRAVDDASGAAEGEMNGLAKDLAAVNAAGAALDKVEHALRPVTSGTRALDKVLAQRVGVRVSGKFVGYTVRQVIESPGKIAGVVLNPLEKLANKALQPVLHTLKLEIRTPPELAAIARRLDRVAARLPNLNKALGPLENALDKGSVASFRAVIAALNARTTSELTAR